MEAPDGIPGPELSMRLVVAPKVQPPTPLPKNTPSRLEGLFTQKSFVSLVVGGLRTAIRPRIRAFRRGRALPEGQTHQ